MKFPALGLEDVMPFGKYKGAKIRVLIMEKPEYLRWLLANMQDFSLDDQADARLEAAEERILERRGDRDDDGRADVYPW